MTAGSNVLGSFSAFCYKFCEQVITGAVMISRVTASERGMCGVLAFVLFFQ